MLSNQLNIYTPSTKFRCSICQNLIEKHFYREHFEHCKNYVIIQKNRNINYNIYTKEKYYLELFNYLDIELGLKKNNCEIESI